MAKTLKLVSAAVMRTQVRPRATSPKRNHAMIRRFGLKEWTFQDIVDVYDPKAQEHYADLPMHCNYCGTSIRYVCVLSPQSYQRWHRGSTFTLYVGNECVHSFVRPEDADDAWRLFHKRWRQRRHYYFIRDQRRKRTIFIGQYANGGWWIGIARSCESWDNLVGRFVRPTVQLWSADAARRYVLKNLPYLEAQLQERGRR